MKIEQRIAKYSRKTAETDIAMEINLDGSGRFTGSSGIGFLDHMLTLLARHGQLDINLTCQGDLEVDNHHTVEDLGICLGNLILKALGEKKGITRYGHAYVPMDETLVRICLDLSGRPYLVYKVTIPVERVGTLETELVEEFFRGLVNHGAMNLHIHLLEGGNGHHIIEAIFKGLGRALKQAVALDPRSLDKIPSTKEVL
ncbi:imidazoleglycerol-phosphate dehydratase HisB [Heliorestis acidaminivorans]|uniref:Imidazoleglycerol-phosphate dehydratase n=1 Tax=Heliorestis acidaminivorans TaxID=553427 RepID=A0A6I0EU09_9FIRM|nr:imidazoleglycerol-phosphate dehydratase HisB [Heliorestis acidaminivorans]KAB2952660.1 imidazoleglycerol-phosphate dehydratase HisB [Heliorestis acidaminivorans]